MRIVSNIDNNRGNLLKIELLSLPFICKEVFTISDVPANVTRGFHAHKITEQLLILVRGAVELKVISRLGTQIISLRSPGDFYHLPPLSWGEEKFLEEGTILQVYASTIYDSNDYITQLSELKKYWLLSEQSESEIN